MKFETIIAHLIILFVGMLTGAVSFGNYQTQNKIEIQKLKDDLLELQSKNLDLIKEKLELKNL